MICIKCDKNQPAWAFKTELNECIFCNPEQVPTVKVEKHDFEEVEDKGCAGGACTL